jgi:aminoglycoside phosphotransferase (APT) family kinase protein
VPTVRWLEPDPAVLGAPFFVMDRVEGRIPPDVMPYTFEGWLLEASPAERRALQDAQVGLLAGIHALDPVALAAEGEDVAFLELPGTGSPLRRHVDHWRRYYDWARAGRRYPLLEAGFDWLEAHWPVEEGTSTLSWGDARIGNVIFDGFTPVAVLDWEMVGIGPPGLDLSWTIFLHMFFQDLTEQMGLPGLPDMFRAEDVAEAYSARTGVPVDELNIDFHVAYAALRHGIVMARIHQRQVHFGEAAPVEDPDDAVMHRARLAQLIGRPGRSPGLP